jgi:antitoxin MazE
MSSKVAERIPPKRSEHNATAIWNGYTIRDVYQEDLEMRVAKWGNSLAVRLPADLVAALNIREGDDIEIVARSGGKLEVSPDERRKRALEAMRRLAVPLPPGYKFDREEANARGPWKPAEESDPGAAAD